MEVKSLSASGIKTILSEVMSLKMGDGHHK